MELFEFDKSFNIPIIGTDEAGRGPGAGPVFAAAVFFPIKTDEKLFTEINDSKKLTAKKREQLFDLIKSNTIYSIQSASVEEIETLNILQASLLAMKRACEDVISQITNDDFKILIDGNKLIKDFTYKQEFVIKGDSKSASIAAASILAKVTRDRFMTALSQEFPMYDWANNKGYLTAKHIAAIKLNGATKWHSPKFLEKLKQSCP